MNYGGGILYSIYCGGSQWRVSNFLYFEFWVEFDFVVRLCYIVLLRLTFVASCVLHYIVLVYFDPNGSKSLIQIELKYNLNYNFSKLQ